MWYWDYIQFLRSPLCILHYIQRGVYNELVHMFGFFSKTCHAISANLGSSKVNLKERIVFRTNDGEVVRHVDVVLIRDALIVPSIHLISALKLLACPRRTSIDSDSDSISKGALNIID